MTSLGGPPVPPPGSIVGTNATGVAVTTASANVEVPYPSDMAQLPFVNLMNVGADTIYVNLGVNNTVIAETTNIPIPSGKCLSLYAGSNTYVAAICATGSSELNVTQSNGPACPI